MRSRRGFINILVVLALLGITFTGVWGVEYLKRINAEKKFRQNVDQLTISAASIQAMSMNGVAILNDGILLTDGIASLVAVTSTVVGIITLITGAGFEIIKDGLELAKKILDIGNKIKDLEKKWVEAAPILTYIPFLMIYSRKIKEFRDTHVLYLPLPLIPSFSTSSGSGGSSDESFTLKLHVKWSVDAAVKALLKQVLYHLDDAFGKAKKKGEKQYVKKVKKVKKKICEGNVVIKGLDNLSGDQCEKFIDGLVGKNSAFFEGLKGFIDAGWNKGFQQLLYQVDNLDLGEGEKVLGLEIPVPAALEKGFVKVQKVGTLAVWKVGTFTPIRWLRSGGLSEKIPVEVMFSRAMPYSRIVDGGVPIVPDWKAVFVPPDLLDALGVKDGG